MDSLGRRIEPKRRFAARSVRSPRRSLLLGVALVVASTVTVLANANTPPTITSASVTPSILGEGQTVTLNATFTDPDATDAHTVEILWKDGTKNKLQLAAGQYSIQATHTYVDNTSSPAHIWLTVKDRQSPVGSEQNDNAEGFGIDTHAVPINVRNVQPHFLRGIAAQKSQKSPGSVMVTGSFADPGVADTHEVRVSWGVEANPLTPIHLCALANKQFTCSYTYPNSASGSYTIRLRVKDDDGDVDNASLQIQLP
jgi:hypothetical protein